jgi:hypothetical protein
LLAVLVVAGCGGGGSGPLADEQGWDEGSAGSSVPAPVGTVLSYGLLTSRNRGDDDAVLDKVSLIHPSDGLELVGAVADENPHVGLLLGFPPKHVFVRRPKPVRGYTVPGKRRFGVVIGFRGTREGRLTFHGLRLDYHVGSKRYHADYHVTGAVCAPPDEWSGHCEAPRS